MTQVERDRLVALRKAEKKIITQKQAAEELGLSTRQVKRMVRALKKRAEPGHRRVSPALGLNYSNHYG